MKLDRRTFLSLGAGATAGTILSPLPWKLMDDSSIWTQNWPWTPVPPVGKVTYENSICTLCPGGCRITVRKVDNRAVKIEGMKGHPVNDGGICMLGLSGLQLLYGPTRIKAPMKRVGERGEGKWKTISWDEATAEIVKQLKALRKDKSQEVACLLGTDKGTLANLFKRFLEAYGSPNFLKESTSDDAYAAVLKLMQGENGNPGYDLENADFILSFGSGVLDGWGSPVRMLQAYGQWNGIKCKLRQPKFVQIEPRCSNTAAKAHTWLPVRPGTEAALALGIAYVLIKESKYDKDFVKSHCKGFEEFSKLVLKKYSLSQVEGMTGLDSRAIADLADQFAKAKNPVAICGRGKGMTPGGLHENMAVHALNALKGSINKTGGVCAVPDIDLSAWPEIEKDDIAAAGLKNKRVDGASDLELTDYALHRLIDKMAASGNSPLQALFISGANPFHTLKDSAKAAQALNKIPFIVNFTSFMDESARQSDLILPNHIYLERYEDVPTPCGIQKPTLGLAKPVVKPLYNTRNTGDVIISIAKALEGTVAKSFPWKDYEECLNASLGGRLKELKKKVYLREESFKPDTKFATKSKRFEFLTKSGLPQFTPVELEGNASSFPLVLIPCETIRITTGYVGNTPFMTKSLEDTVLKKNDIVVEINPKTARKYGLKELDSTVIKTPTGEVSVKVHLFEGIMPDVIGFPKGLGHTAYDGYLKGKGVNYNTLVGSIEDKNSGVDAAWGARARFES